MIVGLLDSIQNETKEELTVHDTPRAVVLRVGGQLILDDPDALAAIQAENKRNCRGTLEANAERVQYFANRAKLRGLSLAECVIVVLNVDDPYGGPIAEMLMPGFNWQEIRDRGEVPVARGLALRDGIEAVLAAFDLEAAEKLRGMTETAVVVVDHGVAEIFPAPAPTE